ncbi:heme-binding protein [Intrasporangium oryzae NRRL B-24470]|uniref:Heme-binding protein n=1 Tax=Intrasporangium oryzae NRRL B-24470 TaxID=1386089 RepID=W9G264_9MICO|nr:heme-binding protein [Intrasporangium oryzae]EWT00201.1 heme-binding protein [Intrasporangium oryzae NRRL B-24470]
MTEQQVYEVVQEFDGFELRRYAPHVVAEVSVRGSFDDAGNRAFRTLVSYIGGNNRSQSSVAMTAPVVQSESGGASGATASGSGSSGEKVAMTAPVVQQPADGGEGDFVVAFVLPASVTLETAPVPLDERVHLKAVPARLAAAVRYSGRWSQESYEQHRAELESALTAAGFDSVGPPRFARFDPPWKPWFLRRNEVVQDVTERSPGPTT